MGLAGRMTVARATARRGLLCGVLVLTVACTPVYRNHGYVPTDNDLSQVNLGATQDEVAQAIGRPATEALLGDGGWYYVQSRFRHFGLREPAEVERQVVAVSFSQDGRVTNIERFGLEKGVIVPLSRRVTETSIQGSTFLRQLFGSVGRLRADQILED